MYWDHMNGWGWMMMIVWIGFLAVVAWVAVQWARGGSHRTVSGQSGATTARELLDEGLARGDNDLDEYQRRRQALEQHTSADV